VTESPRPKKPAPPRSGAVADRVAAILDAAEQSSKRMLDQTEERVRERIAEGERAAQNRVRAAEEEAAEILAHARAEADKAKGDATGEALAIMARAQENADSVLSEAREEALKATDAAQERSRDLVRGARATAGDVQSEGLEIVGDLRELGDAMRSNAERLLRDVQGIHSALVARLAQIDGGFAAAEREQGPRPGSRSGRDRDLPAPPDNGEVLDVPEFIPPP
jgi:cell division septum initiation protein DivIVA